MTNSGNSIHLILGSGVVAGTILLLSTLAVRYCLHRNIQESNAIQLSREETERNRMRMMGPQPGWIPSPPWQPQAIVQPQLAHTPYALPYPHIETLPSYGHQGYEKGGHPIRGITHEYEVTRGVKKGEEGQREDEEVRRLRNDNEKLRGQLAPYV